MKRFKEYTKMDSKIGLVKEQEIITDKGPENLEISIVDTNDNQVIEPTNVHLSTMEQPKDMGNPSTQTVEETKNTLITKLLNFTSQIKIYHWGTDSYAVHKASNRTYEDFSDKLDVFVECYQGYFPRIKFCQCCKHLNLDELNVEEWIGETLGAINGLRSMIQESDLLNILDELAGVLARFKYLLTLK